MAKALSRVDRVGEVFRCARTVASWRSVAWSYIAGGELPYPFPVRTRGGHVLEVQDWSEVTTVWHVFCAQEYRVPRRAETIVDLGANIGAFSVFAIEQRPEARIVAVEPFPSTGERLQRTIQQNRLDNRITAVLAAVQASDGFAWMSGRHDEYSYARRIVGEATAAAIQVPALTLGTLFERHRLGHVDLLKMDTEGGEYAVLETCDRAVLRQCRVIALEYHDSARRGVIWEQLQRAGFRCVRHRPQGWSGVAEFHRQA